MTTKDEALKLALEALEYIHAGANNQGPHTGISWRCVSDKAEPAITAIKQALAEQPDMNLNCKSVQARLATSWGYVKAEQPAQDQSCPNCKSLTKQVTALRTCLEVERGFREQEQPAQQQEPVAWYGVNIAGVKYLGWKYEELDDRGFDVFPLYTSPPASKQFVGLTDEEYRWIYDNGRTPAGMMDLAEAKLREKNNG